VVTRRNRTARPVSYYQQRWVKRSSHKTVASTTMILSGLVVLVFVPLHVYTFKFGPRYPSTMNTHVRDLYRLVVEVFQNPRYVAWYVFAMTVIALHLWHGFGSAFQSLGVTNRGMLYRFGQLLAVILAGGFVGIPVVIFLTGGHP
jgi:succinate dehydrogenase / fumarate reductase cytochrome b subunit